jgi:hypothetical protein
MDTPQCTDMSMHIERVMRIPDEGPALGALLQGWLVDQLQVKALEPTYVSMTYRLLSVESTQTEGVPIWSPKAAEVPGPSL